MSDYTPTLVEVRERYAAYQDKVNGWLCEEFDRWLAQHDSEIADEAKGEWFEFGRKMGLQEAEQRIIKLLEEHAEGDLLFAQNLNTPSEDVAYTMFKGDIIALIKGENKPSHTHRIEVFGKPCDCGTRHEYCADCD